MKKYLLLLKRLFKKPSLYVLFALALILIVSLKSFSIKGEQIASIGIIKNDFFYNGDNLDNLNSQFFKNNNGDSLNFYSFSLFSNFEEGKVALLSGEINELWKFPDNLEETINNFVCGIKIENPIEIYVLDNNVSHLLLREVLYSYIYPQVAERICVDFLNKNQIVKNGKLIQINDFKFSLRFNQNIKESNLFVMKKDILSEKKLPIVLLPLRGMISIWLLVCCFSLGFNYFVDEKNGIFIWWNCKSKLLRRFFYFFFPMIIFALFLIILMIISGVFLNFFIEICAIFLFILSSIIFVNLIFSICGSIKKVGMILPLILLCSTIFSPIFIEFSGFTLISYFLPNYYYLKSIPDIKYLFFEVIYIFILIICIILIENLKNRINRRK